MFQATAPDVNPLDPDLVDFRERLRVWVRAKRVTFALTNKRAQKVFRGGSAGPFAHWRQVKRSKVIGNQ